MKLKFVDFCAVLCKYNKSLDFRIVTESRNTVTFVTFLSIYVDDKDFITMLDEELNLEDNDVTISFDPQSHNILIVFD